MVERSAFSFRDEAGELRGGFWAELYDAIKQFVTKAIYVIDSIYSYIYIVIFIYDHRIP